MKLEVAVTDLSQCRKEISVEVPTEEVAPEFEKAYTAYSRYAKVPGFRPGRVPRGVLKQRFTKEVKDEVVSQLLPHALQHAITDKQLRVVGEPAILELSVAEGEPFRFKVGVEVLPDFELKSYKGLKATKRVVAVTDEQVEEVVNQYRQSNAEFVSIEDRPSQLGDTVSINITGKYLEPTNPAEEEELKTDDLQIELGGEGVQPEFTEALTGVKAGDVREFRVVYPEDFSSPGLAGKTLDFTANVVAVREKEIPEADDDFAQGLGQDFESIAQMRERIREGLTQAAEGRAENRLRNDLVEEMLKEYDFEVPPTLIQQQAMDNTRAFLNQMMQYGLSPHAARDWDWKSHMEREKARAEHDLRAALIIGKVGQAENVNVEAAEIDAEIAEMAAQMGQDPEELKATLTKDEAISTIADRLQHRKALDLIVNNSEITVEQITAQQEAELNRPPAPALDEAAETIEDAQTAEAQPAEQASEEASQPRAEAQTAEQS